MTSMLSEGIYYYDIFDKEYEIQRDSMTYMYNMA